MSTAQSSGHFPLASVAQPPRRRAEIIKYAWARGAAPDTRAALAGDPDLLADKSIVLDLAYEEYCLRREAGEKPDLEEFCNGFAPYRSSLKRLLAAHQFLSENPQLLDQVGPVRWPEPGEQFGDHALLRELGRGSFARVFLATEASTGDRLVALKLSLEGASEAKTLGRLDHPNIVPILSARQDDCGLSVVCMPYRGSATLHDILDQAYPEEGSSPPLHATAILEALRKVTIDEPAALARPADAVFRKGSYVDGVAHMGLQLADALAFIHVRGICHRDFKPSNILLDPSGRPLLIDFNLSSDKKLSSSRAGGTLPYMAPEQLRQFIREGDRAEKSEPDGRADIFSLGVVLYELLTGKNPFGPLPHGLSAPELARALAARQEEGCRPIRDFNPAISAHLARAIENCLAFAPEDRPADAARLADDLRQHFAPVSRLRRWARRRPRIMAGFACVLVLSVSAAAWSAATREPAWVSAHNRGREAFLAGDYARADQYFDQALTMNQQNVASWTARGRTRLAQGSVELALACFDRADLLRPGDGRTLALFAYCEALRDGHREANLWGEKACKAGYATAAVYSNRAFSRLNLPDLIGADRDIDAALALDPQLTAAHYNRAYLARLKWGQSPVAPLNERALEDVRYVLDRSEPSMDLCWDAARYYAAGTTGPNDAKADRAVELLRQTVTFGAKPDRVAEDVIIKMKLAGNKNFPGLFKIPVGTQAKPSNLRNAHLTDPVDGPPE